MYMGSGGGNEDPRLTASGYRTSLKNGNVAPPGDFLCSFAPSWVGGTVHNLEACRNFVPSGWRRKRKRKRERKMTVH